MGWPSVKLKQGNCVPDVNTLPTASFQPLLPLLRCPFPFLVPWGLVPCGQLMFMKTVKAENGFSPSSAGLFVYTMSLPRS